MTVNMLNTLVAAGWTPTTEEWHDGMSPESECYTKVASEDEMLYCEIWPDGSWQVYSTIYPSDYDGVGFQLATLLQYLEDSTTK